MYFWNTRALATELREGTVTEHERMKYLLLYSVGFTALLELVSYSPTVAGPWNITSSIVSVVGTAAGTIYTYQVNRAGDNRDFIGRIVCLGLPIAVRLIAVFIPIAIVLYLLLLGFGVDDSFGGFEEDDSPAMLLLTLGSVLLYYWRLAHHLKWIAQEREGTSPTDKQSF